MGFGARRGEGVGREARALKAAALLQDQRSSLPGLLQAFTFS